MAPWVPGRVRVNGVESGLISGLASVTWRKRDGAAPAVTFYGDDVSQQSDATYKVVVKSGSTVVKTVSGITVETWTFTDEQSLNGGIYFNTLVFEVVAQKPGFADSPGVLISVTR
ncbi:hypothetical protein D3C85_1582980 [compost metagenome]